MDVAHVKELMGKDCDALAKQEGNKSRMAKGKVTHQLLNLSIVSPT